MRGDALEAVAGYVLPQEGMLHDAAADAPVIDLILYIPGNDAAEEQEDAGITGVEQ